MPNPISVRPETIQPVFDCKLCNLCTTARQPVWGIGPANPTIMVIGQNPGEVEDAKGIPFHPTAPSGGLITTIFAELGVSRSEIYWTNAVRCFHGYDNEITPANIKACKPYLLDEIEKVNPKYVVLAGNEALKAIFNHAGITKERGQFKTGPDGRQYFMILHPASALPSRYPENQKIIKQDLAFLLTKIRNEQSPEATIPITTQIVRTEKDLIILEAEIQNHPNRLTAFDYETNSVLTPYQLTSPLVSGLGLAWETHSGWFLPYDHRNPAGIWSPALRSRVKALIVQFLSSKIPKIAHNVKYEYNWSRGYFGIEPSAIAGCTLLLSHLLDASRTSYSLDSLSWDVGMGGYKAALAEWFTARGLEQDDYSQVTLDVLGEYCVKDCVATLRYFLMGMKELKRRNQLKFYVTHVRPGFVPYAEMEANGLLLDLPYFDLLATCYQEKAANHEVELREVLKEQELTVDEAFNFSSTDQVAVLLAQWLGRDMPNVKSAQTGKKKLLSTDKRSLNRLLIYEPITTSFRTFLLKLRYYRQAKKIGSTSVEGFRKFICADNRIRSNYLSEGTKTGRRSSAKPNHQNIAGETAVKRMFIAPPDYFLIGNDYSNLEVRVAAGISHDPKLVAAFAQGADIHTYVASVVYNQSYETMLKVLKAPANKVRFNPKLAQAQARVKKQRAAAKTFVWIMLFGGGPSKAAEDLGISLMEAQKFFDLILNRFSGLRRMFKSLEATALAKGYATNLYGRRRPLPGIESTDSGIRAMALRHARNTPIQGTAGDITLEAATKLAAWLKQAKVRAGLVQEVHDQLVLEVHYADAYQVAIGAKTIMEGIRLPQAPEMTFTVDSTIGCHLGSKRAVDFEALKTNPKAFYTLCKEELLLDPRQYVVQNDDDFELAVELEAG